MPPGRIAVVTIHEGPQGDDGTSFTAKPPVDTASLLPLTGNTAGDFRVATDTGHGWTWDGAAWVDQGQWRGDKGDPGPAGTGGVDAANTLDVAGGVLTSDGKLTWLTTKQDGSPTAYAVSKLNAAGIVAPPVASVNGQTGAVVFDAADVGATPDLPVSLTTAWGDQREYPRLVKPLDGPLLTFADMPAMYWPTLVDRRPMGGTGVSLMTSTDHGVTGGLYGAHATSPLGPFVVDGLLYVDAVDGSQTETPAVIWNEATGLYHVYYSQSGTGGGTWTGLGEQSTFLATTPDLVTFTRVGRVLDMIAQTEAGDGHTGYFRPIRIGASWYGFSLYGGHDQPRWAIWQSADGLAWHQHPWRLGHNTPLITGIGGVDTLTRLTIGGTIIRWRGRWWLFGRTVFGSGGGLHPGAVAVAPLSDDLRHLAARPLEIVTDPQAWEGDGGINLLGPPFAWDGHLYMTYRAGPDTSANSAIGLLEVV